MLCRGFYKGGGGGEHGALEKYLESV